MERKKRCTYLAGEYYLSQAQANNPALSLTLIKNW